MATQKQKPGKRKVLFSDTYMENKQVLVTAKDSNITSFDAMKDKVLGHKKDPLAMIPSTINQEVLKDIVADNEATLYASFNEAFIDLENGRIDGLLIDRPTREYYLTAQTKKADDYNVIEVLQSRKLCSREYEKTIKHWRIKSMRD